MRRPQVPLEEDEYEIIESYAAAKGLTFRDLVAMAIEDRMNRSKVLDLHDRLLKTRIGQRLQRIRAPRSTAQGALVNLPPEHGKSIVDSPLRATTGAVGEN